MGNLNLHYTGTVKISYKNQKQYIERITHNIGLEPLFRFWARALVGENVSGEIPSTIDLQKLENSSWTSVLNRPISISSLTYAIEDNSWVNKITATLSYDQFVDHSSIRSTDEYRIVLQSSVSNFATLDVSPSDLMRISKGTQAIIEWVLKITN